MEVPLVGGLDAPGAELPGEQHQRRVRQVHWQLPGCSGHRSKKSNELVPDLAVANPPIMQLLERGFIRDDAFEGGSQRRPKPTFNAEALSTLAKFGFSPGSKFGDTMHFDFIEGYSTLIDGGRSAANIRKDRASPENGLPVMPPTAAQLRAQRPATAQHGAAPIAAPPKGPLAKKHPGDVKP